VPRRQGGATGVGDATTAAMAAPQPTATPNLVDKLKLLTVAPFPQGNARLLYTIVRSTFGREALPRGTRRFYAPRVQLHPRAQIGQSRGCRRKSSGEVQINTAGIAEGCTKCFEKKKNRKRRDACTCSSHGDRGLFRFGPHVLFSARVSGPRLNAHTPHVLSKRIYGKQNF
jgi:hypothetical protein